MTICSGSMATPSAPVSQRVTVGFLDFLDFLDLDACLLFAYAANSLRPFAAMRLAAATVAGTGSPHAAALNA